MDNAVNTSLSVEFLDIALLIPRGYYDNEVLVGVDVVTTEW